MKFTNNFDNIKGSTFNNEGNVSFEDGKSLTNNGTFNAEADSVLTTSGNGKLTNNATVNAKGATFKGKIKNEANGTIETTGNNTFDETIENNKDATFTAKDGNVKIEQDLTNKGTLNAEAGSSFSGAGKIANSGTDTSNKGKLDAKGATFEVEVENKENGEITANGDNSFKKVTNEKGATFTNNGNTTFAEGITNKGTLDAEANSTISGAITNDGTAANDNGTLNAKGATFNGAVTNNENGKIATSGTDTNNFAGGVTNKGTFEASENSKISGDITNEKTLTAKGATFDSTITNGASGTITAKDSTNTFNGAITNSGTIEAKDATFNGEVITSKTLTLEGGNTFNGNVTNSENATLTNEGENTFNGDLVNKGTIEAENGSSFKGTGTIQNEKTLNAKGATFENTITNGESGKITATGENTFTGSVTNQGTFEASDTSKIQGTGTITNESSGTITANGATFENTIDNKGTLKAEAAENKTNSFSEITTNAGSKIEVSGKGTNTFSKSFVNVKDATFTNSTEGNGKATLSEGLINDGTITNSANANIEISQNKILTNNGKIDAENGSKFTGNGTITNNGELNAKGATFSGKVTNESGTINVSGDNTFTGGVDNKGTLNAEASSTIKVGTLTNESSGVINAKGATFEGAITNSGKITASGTNAFNKAITTNADSTIEITDGTTTFKEDLTNVADATLINKGEIKIETNGKKLINQGLLEAESGSTFSGDGSIENEKTLNAKGATFDTAITNKASGNITASGENSFNKAVTTSAQSTITISDGKTTFAEDFENVENATLKNSGTISIDTSKKIINKGLLEAESGSTFSGDGSIENKKTLNAKGATFDTTITNEANGVISASGENNFNKKITTSENSTITISDGKTTFAEDFSNKENAKLINNGEVVFSKAFTNKAGTLTNNGEIIFNGKADFKDKDGTNAVDYTNQSSSTLTFNDSAEFKGLTNQGGTININGDGDGQATKNFKADTITNYGNINANGAYIEATNGLTNRSIFRANNGALSTIKGKFNNEAKGNVYLQGTTLKVTDEFKNDGNLIFSFLGDNIGQIDASDTNAKFTNTENKGKVQVDISGSGKNIGEKTIITGKDDDNDGTFENITLNESDISFIGGSGKYLGNGKVLIDEVFANVPTGTINTPIIATNKANVASMNSMFLVSNAIISSNIYNAKYTKMAKGETSRGAFALSALKANESFYYDSKPLLLADARDSAQSQASGAQNAKDNFYFLLTPFVNHTSFKPVGGMSVSGLDYGFITAFGGKVAPDNTLGLHFVFDYAKLGDKHDKSLSATNKNIMVGLNYRLDLIYEMYLKARGDFYYFMNDVNSNATGKSSPNNLGGGVNVAFGKDFVDWKQAGVLGIELGLDYKALSTGKVSTEAIFGGSNDGIYDKALYHILYADLGLNYYKYFSTNVGLWGLDAGLGARANLTPKVSSNRLMIGNRNIDITLDNDNFLGYVSVGGSYVLEAQNYDMEFTLRYNGSFGDKTISNGGSFEWRTKW